MTHTLQYNLLEAKLAADATPATAPSAAAAAQHTQSGRASESPQEFRPTTIGNPAAPAHDRRVHNAAKADAGDIEDASSAVEDLLLIGPAFVESFR